MYRHQPHPATPISDAAVLVKSGKKRGNYNCGRCGAPKKGHVCNLPKDIRGSFTPVSTPAASAVAAENNSVIRVSSGSVTETTVRPLPPPGSRRALSFDDFSEVESREELELECYEAEFDMEMDMVGKIPANCLWDVLRRLPPVGLLTAAMVCKGWRETTKKLWKVVEELRLRVPAKAQIGYFGSMLQKCPGLIKLCLTMERSGIRS